MHCREDGVLGYSVQQVIGHALHLHAPASLHRMFADGLVQYLLEIMYFLKLKQGLSNVARWRKHGNNCKIYENTNSVNREYIMRRLYLSVSALLDALHEDDLCGHEGQLQLQTLADDLRPHLQQLDHEATTRTVITECE